MAVTDTGADAFRLACDTPDTVSVSGVLSFSTATQALRSLNTMLASGERRQLDLAAVSGCDSAGLACVLAVLAEASRRGQSVRLQHVPAGMQTLAKVSGVDSLLA